MNTHVAVVGCGQWGVNLVRNFHALGVLGAVADPALKEAPEKYGVPLRTFEELLQDPAIEAMALAVPAPLHAPLGLQALEAGKHVLIEKPMGLSSAQVRALIKTAEDNKRILMGGHLLRYHPAFLVLERYVRSGMLGNLLFVDAYRQTFGRVCLPEKNVFWSLSPHDISLVLALMGGLPQEVRVLSDKVFSAHDQGVAHLSFGGGRRARILTSWIYPKKEQRLVVVGDKGSLIFDDTAEHKLIHYPHAMEGALPTLLAGLPEVIPYEDHEPLKEECRHFLSAIKDGREPVTNGEESLRVMKVLEAIDASMEADRSVAL